MPFNDGFFRPDETAIDYAENIGDPGQFPFTRGIYPTMYRGKKPTVRQFAGHGLSKDTNARFKKIRALGGTGLSTAFDLCTLMGLDSDHPKCEGQVGWDGVAIDTLDDMITLFDGISLGDVTVSMTINAPAATLLAMYVAVAERRGIPRAMLGGTTQNDILKEYIAQKEWLFPVDKGVKLVTDTIEFCAQHMPKWHPVSISGYHIREAGSSASQELAYTIANGLTYVDRAIERGLAIDAFAPRLSFFFDVHNDFFEEIAKFRAARRIWARLIRDRYHPKDPKSLLCRIHAQTAGCTLTRKEPMNNIMRVANQALAAMLGGAQSIHTNSWDEVFCTPTEQAVGLAIRTQQILQEETGICDVVDPLGGAWNMEDRTNRIEAEALKEIGNIEKLGGMEKAVAAWYPQKRIHQHAAQDQERVEQGLRKIIGVNAHADAGGSNDSEIEGMIKELDERRGFEEKQITHLRAIKASRAGEHVDRAILALKHAAERNQNVMPALIEAAHAYATLGEISEALQNVWGTYEEKEIGISTLSPKAKEAIIGSKRFTRPVRILLAKGGLDGHTRGIWILANLFRDMGAEVIYLGLHQHTEAIAKAALEEDVDIVGLSTLIGSPVMLFGNLRKALERYGKDDVLVIGGGIVTPDDKRYIEQELKVGRLFEPDTPMEHIAEYLFGEVKRRGIA
ncbi:MAG: methylmalonyl-CoA mutase family protein [bacterium]|nr:methylmalonyl-CoA mutase family protein [bacterium]